MQTLERYISLFIARGKTAEAYEFVSEWLTNSLESSRASVWFYNEFQDAIRCEDLYDARTRSHFKNIELEKNDFPAYFEGLEAGLDIVASNAHTHPSTHEFLENYFDPNDIYSLLDVPIFVHGKLVGVACTEHCGEFREWTDADIAKVREVASQISRMLESVPTAA